MKGATVLVGPSVGFLRCLEAAAMTMGLGVVVGTRSLQLTDPSGRLLTAFGDAEPEWEWHYIVANEPDRNESSRMNHLVGYTVECRWEDMFCEVVWALAAQLCSPVWVIDADGLLWAAGSLDPLKICL